VNGQGFQFSPMGIIPLPEGEVSGVDDESFSPGAVALAAVAPRTIPRPAPSDDEDDSEDEIRPASKIKTGSLKPRDVVKLAKRRLREIKAELKHHERLKREKASLERLVEAASKPVALVRPIDSARRSAG